MKEYGPVEHVGVLEKFKCQMRFFGDDLEGDDFTAYCMDDEVSKREGKKHGVDRADMRFAAQLGTCNCCDYMQIRGDTILLIETTDVLRTIKYIRSECDGMQERKKAKHINKMIKIEFVQKLYGGLLVLCRMGICKNLHTTSAFKKIAFMLVHNGPDEWEGLDSLRIMLYGAIWGELSNEIDVHILSADKAESKLQQCA